MNLEGNKKTIPAAVQAIADYLNEQNTQVAEIIEAKAGERFIIAEQIGEFSAGCISECLQAGLYSLKPCNGFEMLEKPTTEGTITIKVKGNFYFITI